MQEVIRDRLKKATTIVVSFNNMKKIQSSSSYLNIMFQYCDQKDGIYETMLFDVISLHTEITAASVKQLVAESLRKFGIAYPNIFWFEGDNGSYINSAIVDAKDDFLAPKTTGTCADVFAEAGINFEEYEEEDFFDNDIADYNSEAEDTEFHQHFIRYHPCAVHTLMRVLKSSTTAVGIVQKLLQSAVTIIEEIDSSFELTQAFLQETNATRRLTVPPDSGWLSIYYTFKYFISFRFYRLLSRKRMEVLSIIRFPSSLKKLVIFFSF